MFSWLLSLLQSLLDSAYASLKTLFWWLWGQLASLVNSIAAALSFPELEIPTVDPMLLAYLDAANDWVPVQEMWVALVSYVTIWIGAVGVRFALKFVGLLTTGGW